MVSRTTDDYERMAIAGCEAICEPAFWAGYDRASVQGFYDYFRQLTEYEPARAAKFGIPHFCWLCINPKESEDAGFAREVLSIIPDFIDKPTVLGIGEIGLNKNTKNELAIFEEHVAIAKKYDQPILIHTPHLEDKLKGTKLILDSLKNANVDPSRVVIDHVEEHTQFGDENIWMNSACDWGCSDPLAVIKCALEMKKRDYVSEHIDKVIFENPKTFLSRCPNFKI